MRKMNWLEMEQVLAMLAIPAVSRSGDEKLDLKLNIKCT